MCFENLIGIYEKKLSNIIYENGDCFYLPNNTSYIINRYVSFNKNIKTLLLLLKNNQNDSVVSTRCKNSDKLFLDLYYKFNK